MQNPTWLGRGDPSAAPWTASQGLFGSKFGFCLLLQVNPNSASSWAYARDGAQGWGGLSCGPGMIDLQRRKKRRFGKGGSNCPEVTQQA